MDHDILHTVRVIVAGATAWANAAAIRRELSRLPQGTVVIYGDAPGADALAGQIAAELGLIATPMVKSAADRKKYGRGAWKGLNERMLAADATLVLIFHPDVAKSSGSRHLAELAAAAGVPVQVFTD